MGARSDCEPRNRQLSVNEQGIVSDCKLEQVSGAAVLNAGEEVPRCRPGYQFQSYRDASGNPIAKRIRARVEIEEFPAK